MLAAPIRFVNIYGHSASAWYNIKRIGSELIEEQGDIEESAKRIHEIFNTEANLLKGNYKKIFIGGVSQGCVISLFSGLSFNKEIGGIVGLSGYLNLKAKIPTNYKNLKIFLYHGTMDETLNYEMCMGSYERLKPVFGKNLKIVTEKGLGHTVSDEEIKKVQEFMHKIMI